jgi:hypothetical protein
VNGDVEEEEEEEPSEEEEDEEDSAEAANPNPPRKPEPVAPKPPPKRPAQIDRAPKPLAQMKQTPPKVTSPAKSTRFRPAAKPNVKASLQNLPPKPG